MFYLSGWDWLIIVVYLFLSLGISLSLKSRGTSSLSDFFAGGRKMPWYLAGISMVATTFAADTPLTVTEIVAENGISGNWLWWNMLIGGMLTTFFFARLWRRSGVLTELELVELRYAGKPAAYLRGFKAIYMGVFLNVLIMGWVNLAMMGILQVFFGLEGETLFLVMFGLMAFTAFYASIAGIWGVAATDGLQFVLAMLGCIVLAVLVLQSDAIGGMSGLKAQLPAWQLRFLPQWNANADEMGYSIGLGAFATFAGVQWWASWYPGAEPGGGGYVVQRMLCTRSEKDSFLATLFFQMAHYCLRPWPWIVVGLCAVVLYPNLQESRLGFVYAMRDFLPAGLKGLLLVAFFAAYMSTISTQLNWGASFLMNDVYLRFINKNTNALNQNYSIWMSRLFTIILMLLSLFATTQMDSIKSVWEFLLQCGAGLGLVLILRWYWWRINVWSEWAATLAPFLIMICNVCFPFEQWLNDDFVKNNGIYFITVGGTTIIWFLATLATKAEPPQQLQLFYDKVNPGGFWYPYQHKEVSGRGLSLTYAAVSWLAAVILAYALLFLIGYLILGQSEGILQTSLSALLGYVLLRFGLKRSGLLRE